MGLLQLLKSQFLCHLILCYVFVVSGLFINLLQFCTLPVWMVSKQLARRINIRLAYCLSSQMVAMLEWWSGTECTLYTEPQSYRFYGKENAIVVLNHSYDIDFLCGWTFCERFGVLGSSKVLAKKELSYVPVIGWMWYFLEIVFCKRKWEEDRTLVAQSLQKLHDYPEHFWFLLYCEGTRFTPKKHQVSMQVAESKGLPILKHHLLPRTKGFWVTVQNLRGKAAAVYDSTLNFQNNEKPTLLGVLNGEKYHADLYVRRIPLDLIPEDEAECAAWLHKLYQEKDSFQEQYTQTGRFPGPIVSPPRRLWSLINWLFWSCLMLYPLGVLLTGLISSGSMLSIIVSLVFCSAADLTSLLYSGGPQSLAPLFWGSLAEKASVGVRWMIGQTEINKSSNYGNKE
ncbi:1-acyl-sn-glycerol-3-phosphate acyltransferase delta isoform X2 [Gouania willdenowi]|uniref:1-acyl-sn-glycerol-3-phosphate acyltransferase delta isoform X2 n=1 Tax=Gouania willdenowi TaxID=441366 RepID=UPI001056C8C5|nr:1-acyl-sn-glycerol-3-phosphate acyltransferase delta isoform X2 [Gouania willdenowi]